jgi:hypothetical protein
MQSEHLFKFPTLFKWVLFWVKRIYLFHLFVQVAHTSFKIALELLESVQ